jgi:hypothetical protein
VPSRSRRKTRVEARIWRACGETRAGDVAIMTIGLFSLLAIIAEGRDDPVKVKYLKHLGEEDGYGAP